MDKIDNLKIGSKYLFITKENREFKGVFIDKDARYVYLKNVRIAAKFVSVYVLPIKELARVS